MKLLSYILLILLIGCSNPVTPKLDISGRYESSNMILLLNQTNDKEYTAILDWNGISTELKGILDRDNSQLILTGNYQGVQNISFNLYYSNGVLAGGYNYNLMGTQAVRFIFRNGLRK